MLRRIALMLTLAAIAVLVVAPAAQSKTVPCQPGKVCKGTNAADVIVGSQGNDNIRPMGGNDYVFANGGDDQVAHSYGDDRIFGGCGRDTVRGGFGLDRIFANMPTSWPLLGTDSPCAHITQDTLPPGQSFTTLAQAEGADVPDSAHDLVDCAWIASREDPQSDEGFGSVEDLIDGTLGDTLVDDTVVDCSNRDDQ
jgi:Ca2+-binding RTX toxin-like protein